MANKHLKSYIIAIKEIQFESTLRSHLLPTGWLLLRKRMATDAGEDAEEREFLSSTGGMYISTGTAAIMLLKC